MVGGMGCGGCGQNVWKLSILEYSDFPYSLIAYSRNLKKGDDED